MGLGDDLRELVGVDTNGINANAGINDITLNQTIDSKKNGSYLLEREVTFKELVEEDDRAVEANK